jgi:hypothetical protein
VGEYQVATLIEARMFNHMAFSTLARLVTKGFVQDANVTQPNNSRTVVNTAPRYLMEYGYAWAYGRTLTDNMWNEDRNIKIPVDLKAQADDLFGRLTGNGFRMSLYLQNDALDAGRLSAVDISNLKGWMDNSINASNGSQRDGAFVPMKNHFARYHAANLAADQTLMDSLRTRLGITNTFW